MNESRGTHLAAAEQASQPTDEHSRRAFLKNGGIGLAGVAGTAAMGLKNSSLAYISASSPSLSRFNRTRGVLPIVLVIV